MGPTSYNVEVANNKQARGLVQLIGVCTTCVGLFQVCAGRANSDWGVALTIFERLAATTLFAYVYSTGTISLQQLISQACIDGGSTMYTYYLYLQDLDDSKRSTSKVS